MFGQNRKIDSKIRFQRRQFKQRLKLARSYKRPIGQFGPESRRQGRKAPLLVWLIGILVLILAIYFIYLPNPFDIKNIKVNGLNQQQTAQLQTLVNQYFFQNKLWPQNNIVLLNKKSLIAFVLARDRQIISVNAIAKNLPDTLTISAVERENSFILTSPKGTFILGNDNLVTAFNGAAASTTLAHQPAE